jgi:tetratricopeptide (TPR) repeat protein
LPNKDGAQSPELVKLADKFRKDPASKLFFPLAEEYAKAGRIDEAIELLRTGIKAHPDLLGARVSLGKALLAKGRHAEAQAEFEQVIVANPDNIMAQETRVDLCARRRQTAGGRVVPGGAGGQPVGRRGVEAPRGGRPVG